MAGVRSPQPWVVEMPARPDFALHVGTDSTLNRRAPTFDVPAPLMRVVVPRPQQSPASVGALAREALLLPFAPVEVRYALPPGLGTEIGVTWGQCPTTGLQLPEEEQRVAWFRAHSGCEHFWTPSNLGVVGDAAAKAEAAWAVLTSVDSSAAAAMLLDIATRLEMVGPDHELNARLAAPLTRRQRFGFGLWQAARVGRVWLMPACLRWIVRELAAHHVASRSGTRSSDAPTLGGLSVFYDVFEHLALGAPVDELDLLVAAWLLHEAFDGGPADSSVSDDPLAFLTALGHATSSRVRVLHRFVTWDRIWSVSDNHDVGARHSWNGQPPPSALRRSFEAATGFSVHRWFSDVCEMAVHAASAAYLGKPMQFRPLSDGTQARPTTEVLARHCGTSLELLGRDVIASCDYRGLGTTPQANASVMSKRPVMCFDDGSLLLMDVDAFARSVTMYPQEALIGHDPTLNRRDLQGVIGYMFEAHGSDLLRGLPTSHQVLTGDDIDSVVSPGTARADGLVVNDDAAALFEFSIQPTPFGALAGHAGKCTEILNRYAKKAAQADATPVNGVLASRFRRLGPLGVCAVLVVDDELPMAAPHRYALAAAAASANPSGVISIDDLSELVELARHGHSAPHALHAWLASDDPTPFRIRLDRLARLAGPRHWDHVIASVLSRFHPASKRAA